MVVQEDRRAMQTALLAYMRGEISNFEFEERALGRLSKDHGVREVYWAVWGSYDEFAVHSIRVSLDRWKCYRRCLAFLDTALEPTRHRRHDLAAQRIWPFESWKSIYKYRRNFSRPELPRFDPAIHQLPIRTRFEEFLLWLPVILLTLAVTVFLAWTASK